MKTYNFVLHINASLDRPTRILLCKFVNLNYKQGHSRDASHHPKHSPEHVPSFHQSSETMSCRVATEGQKSAGNRVFFFLHFAGFQLSFCMYFMYLPEKWLGN